MLPGRALRRRRRRLPVRAAIRTAVVHIVGRNTGFERSKALMINRISLTFGGVSVNTALRSPGLRMSNGSSDPEAARPDGIR